MKKILLGLFAVTTIFILTACGGDNREAYIEQLEALDRTDLSALNHWLDENSESIDELFTVREGFTDVDGDSLNASDVEELPDEFFVSWDVEVESDGQRLRFTYTWDRAAYRQVQEEEAEAELQEIRASLIGNWENGGGDRIDAPIRGAVWVEFNDDGTLVAVDEDGRERSGSWEVERDRIGEIILQLSGDRNNFEINGEVLTITRNSNSRVFHRAAEGAERPEEVVEEPEPEPEPAAEESSNDTSSSSSSSSTSDWRRFLSDYDAWMTRFLRNPTDIAMLGELVEWAERSAEISAGLSGNDLIEFTTESLRIAGRALE